MKLVITEIWQKVVPDASHPLGTRVLPDYEVKSSTSYPNGGGWGSRTEWTRSVKKRHGFLGFDENGRTKFALRPAYGIHSYQLVSLED